MRWADRRAQQFVCDTGLQVRRSPSNVVPALCLLPSSRIVHNDQYHCDNYEAVELSVLRHKEEGVCAFVSDRREQPESFHSRVGQCDHRTYCPPEFSMSKSAITSPELAPPVGPFSPAVDAGG